MRREFIPLYGAINRVAYFSTLAILPVSFHSPILYSMAYLLQALGSLLGFMAFNTLKRKILYISALVTALGVIYIPYTLPLVSFGLGLVSPILVPVAVEKGVNRSLYVAFSLGIGISAFSLSRIAVILFALLAGVLVLFLPTPSRGTGGIQSIRITRAVLFWIFVDMGIAGMFSLILNLSSSILAGAVSIFYIVMAFSRTLLKIDMRVVSILTVGTFPMLFLVNMWEVKVIALTTFAVFYAHFHPQLAQIAYNTSGDPIFNVNAVFTGDTVSNVLFPITAENFEFQTVIAVELISIIGAYFLSKARELEVK
ncbi:hypothetical protein HS7_00140 [Sulfolobales archaeon HS-7]|nr:hypothetical protein HS7_00140 [Sulfolobales archaeon HS-7]